MRRRAGKANFFLPWTAVSRGVGIKVLNLFTLEGGGGKPFHIQERLGLIFFLQFCLYVKQGFAASTVSI